MLGVETILTKSTLWRRANAKPSRRTELTQEEQQNVRSALRVLRARLGGDTSLAKMLGITFSKLAWCMSRRGKPGASLAIYAARLASVPVEDILTGAFSSSNTCPLCGRVTIDGNRGRLGHA